MTEHEIKELGKWFLDNGQRKLTQAEKDTIKSAIDRAGSIYELLQIAITSAVFEGAITTSLPQTNPRISHTQKNKFML